MSIKVVSIVSRMNVGGPAVLLSELIRRLPSDQFSHTLITGRCLDNEIDFLDAHPLDSKVIYVDDIQRSILPIADIRSLIRLVRILRNENPNIVHTHTSKAGVIGRIASRIANPQIIVIHTFHGHLLYGYFSKFKTRLIVILEIVLAKITNVFVAVTEQVKLDLIGVGIGTNSKWAIIHPGVSASRYLSKQDARDLLKIGNNKFVYSWIGRFTDIKNPMLAIQAFENIENKSELYFLMAGDGELLEECMSYARARNLPINFLGWITDINPILSASDFVLMTSRNEGMPVVIVESALKGVPVLTTDVGGVTEFVADGVTGWLIEQNAELISQKISGLIKNIGLIEPIGKNAQRFANNEFSVEMFVDEHVSLYNEVAH